MLPALDLYSADPAQHLKMTFTGCTAYDLDRQLPHTCTHPSTKKKKKTETGEWPLKTKERFCLMPCETTTFDTSITFEQAPIYPTLLQSNQRIYRAVRRLRHRYDICAAQIRPLDISAIPQSAADRCWASAGGVTNAKWLRVCKRCTSDTTTVLPIGTPCYTFQTTQA